MTKQEQTSNELIGTILSGRCIILPNPIEILRAAFINNKEEPEMTAEEELNQALDIELFSQRVTDTIKQYVAGYGDKTWKTEGPFKIIPDGFIRHVVTETKNKSADYVAALLDDIRKTDPVYGPKFIWVILDIFHHDNTTDLKWLNTILRTLFIDESNPLTKKENG